MPAEPRITVPTLMLWGVNDLALRRELAQPSIDLCDDGRLVFFEDASHWVHHEEPERVNELIVAFLDAEAPSPAV
jgi:epoxide hydrolase 4